MPGYKVRPTADNEDVYMEFLCAECGNLLKKPYQLHDGERVCESCLNDSVGSRKDEKTEISNGWRPYAVKVVSDGDADSCVVRSKPYFPDRFASEQILNIRVHCENERNGCEWTGKVADLQKHLQYCRGGELDEVLISTKPEMAYHSTSLVNQTKDGCPFNEVGCEHAETMDRNQLEKHIAGNLVVHLLFLLSAIRNIGMNLFGHTKTQIEMLWEKVKQICNDVGQIRNSYRSLADDLERKNHSILEMQTKLLAQEVQMEEQILALSHMQKELEKSKNQIAALRGGFFELKNASQQQSNSGETISLPAPVMPPVDSPDHIVSHDGVLLWKITKILQKRQDAILKKVPSILSPPFFTSERGYKLCARLYLNGDGPARGQCLSLFFAVMRGPFDAILSWPFKFKITMTLIDQDNIAHHEDSFKPDLTSSSFQRPKTDINVASGSPFFFKLDSLDPHAYIKDDTMFIKVAVDTSTLKT